MGLQYTGIDNLTLGVGTSDISPGAKDGGSDSDNSLDAKYVNIHCWSNCGLSNDRS